MLYYSVGSQLKNLWCLLWCKVAHFNSWPWWFPKQWVAVLQTTCF